ncbi:unnamed protein product [Sphenostylis stenocarpa]|uniref:Uncharacterized protein n=1 Tax=Sphenostylis stenocarpa TaxID=92480 RepID=A0AA86SMK0_9FABA|nr:unnamed protein product [Sphenostylis stenocarpa]
MALLLDLVLDTQTKQKVSLLHVVRALKSYNIIAPLHTPCAMLHLPPLLSR